MTRRTWARAAFAALSTGLGVGFWMGVVLSVPTAESPHAYMDNETKCAGCHRVVKEGEDWVLDPHIFRRSVPEICQACHPPQRMGRSHPVGSDPIRKLRLKEMPEGLPLQLVEGDRDELMTCGTCHNPHAPRLARQKLYSRQTAFPGRPGEYLTYYLRTRSADPRDGFTPLCKSCHPKL